MPMYVGNVLGIQRWEREQSFLIGVLIKKSVKQAAVTTGWMVGW